MSARMEHLQTTAASSDNKSSFSVDFPFLSVIATGKHTEIVLTRGIGLHTILGFSIDLAVGTLLDRCGKLVSQAVGIAGVPDSGSD